MQEALHAVSRQKSFPAITKPRRFGELLSGMTAHKGEPVVDTALFLMLILCQRPGNLRMMQLAQFELCNKAV